MRTTITRWKCLGDPMGVEQEVSWVDFFTELSKAGSFSGDFSHPGWSPAKFDPCRRALENVQHVFAMCLDYDDGETIAAALTTWREFFGLLHTTRKHRSDAPRFRVILPFSRPVSVFEYESLWPRIDAHTGGKLDQQPKDPSRFWYMPGTPDGGEFEAHRLVGAMMINPDRWLAKPLPVAPKPTPAPVEQPTDTLRQVEKRAIAYIAKMPEAISGSGGHLATWRVAVMLAKGFGLDEATTYSILARHYNPRCVPEWSEKELKHKAKQAQTARAPDGFKRDDDRDWEPARVRIEAPPDPDPDYDPSDPFASPDVENEPSHGSEPSAPPAPKQTAAARFGLLSMFDLMKRVADELNKPRPRMGAQTGSAELDVAIGGFRQGNVTVFGAKRGFGKTSYGNMVTNLAVPNLNVVMFAGEDAAEMYGKRFLAMRANLNAMLLRDYKCNAEDWPRIADALSKAPQNPFFVRVEGRPVEWMAKVIQEISAEQRIDLVVVDYLQKMKTAARLQDRRNEVTYVTATLHDAVKKASAAGLFFSQLKRTERQEPEIEDLKESGDIEDMADHILLGWKEEAASGGQASRFVKVAKNKDGTEASEIATIEMGWCNKTANFIPTKFESDPYGFDDMVDNA